jgi:hypothetical protein
VVTAVEAVAEGSKAAATAEVEIAAHLKVEAIAAAEDLAARHRAGAIVAVLPEVVRHAAEETRRHQTVMDETVDLLGAGWRPAFPPVHRQEASQGASCSPGG